MKTVIKTVYLVCNEANLSKSKQVQIEFEIAVLHGILEKKRHTSL